VRHGAAADRRAGQRPYTATHEFDASAGADIAFVGANGIAAGFGLSTPDVDEAAVKTAIVRSARRVVLLADSSKFSEETLISFANLEDIDALITDRAPRGSLADALSDADVEVIVA
jgi:DeoR family fructose operon transcriptional repressor